MRENLLDLISQIEEMESLFYKSGGDEFSEMSSIHNVDEFIGWKNQLIFELERLNSHEKDSFIDRILTNLKEGFNGWSDKSSFAELKGSLLVVENNIDKYCPLELKNEAHNQEVDNMKNKETKIFISHSSKDKKYVSDLVELLEYLGLRKKHLFCTSVISYGIPIDEDIYEYLKKQFDEYELHVFFILSDNYYNSVASLNEMGAAWILQKKYTTILTPGFEFKDIKGAISPNKIALRLDGETNDLKEMLGQLKDLLIEQHELEPIEETRWEIRRNQYIETIKSY